MLLTYAFWTSPDPLQVSTATGYASGRIEIAVFNPDGEYCDQIALRVPVGTDAPAFGTAAPSASVSTAKWRTELQLSVTEHSGTDAASMTWNEVGTFQFDKAWPRFYLQNVVAAAPDAPAQPVTEFPAGAPIRLSWDSNGTWFEVYEKAQAAPVYGGTAAYCDLPGVMTDTTLFVVASGSGDPAGAEDGTDFEPIALHDSLAVTVSNPVLTPTSVIASGPLGRASLDVSGTVSAATVSASGEVSGGSLFTTGSVSAASVAATGQVAAASVIAEESVLAGGGPPIFGETTVGAVAPDAFAIMGLNESGQPDGTAGGRSAGYFSNAGGSSTVDTMLAVNLPDQVGVWTNGTFVSMAGSSIVTELPTRAEPRTVTSPLSAGPEIHLSGPARLEGGRAVVELDADAADVALHTAEHQYRVNVTPAGMCNGLAVTDREPGRFVVERARRWEVGRRVRLVSRRACARLARLERAQASSRASSASGATRDPGPVENRCLMTCLPTERTRSCC